MNRDETQTRAEERKKRRLTRQRLSAFAARHASDQSALVVHSHDLDHASYFPNARHISPRATESAGVRADPPYDAALSAEDADRYDVVVCTGFLEHVADPTAFVRALARVLAPGGMLLVSASGVFSYHNAPNNFFHFAPDGLRKVLTSSGLSVVELEGSTGPFETLGVLTHRIRIQCDAPLVVRAGLRILGAVLPFFDRFVGEQRRGPEVDHDGIGIMPATLFAVALKSGET